MVCVCTLSVHYFYNVLLFAACHDDPVFLFFSQGNNQLQNGDSNSRHASLSEEEENLAVLRRWGIGWGSFICNQITQQMDCENGYLIMYSAVTPPLLSSLNHFDLSFFFSICLTLYSLPAFRHVMNELLETERAYVEELLCVLQVFIYSTEGFIFWILPVAGISCFVFGCYRDMPLRWTIQPCLISSLLLCRTKRRFCLATCRKFTTSIRGD